MLLSDQYLCLPPILERLQWVNRRYFACPCLFKQDSLPDDIQRWLWGNHNYIGLVHMEENAIASRRKPFCSTFDCNILARSGVWFGVIRDLDGILRKCLPFPSADLVACVFLHGSLSLSPTFLASALLFHICFTVQCNLGFRIQTIILFCCCVKTFDRTHRYNIPTEHNVCINLAFRFHHHCFRRIVPLPLPHPWHH